MNGYTVRDNLRTQVCNQCFRAEVLPPGELTCIKLAIVRAQKLHIFWSLIIFLPVCCLIIIYYYLLLIALENNSFY